MNPLFLCTFYIVTSLYLLKKMNAGLGYNSERQGYTGLEQLVNVVNEIIGVLGHDSTQ